ncbi:hypothetical protein CC1G_14860 [Coprinopsis cinerea okayama7|uniref:FAD/NAD(P)-binding domain-containing protein n=1 Tax=Coprinopsis cinerea (strain Okayama-7 / 130 / ATCC MYA-4618 / FGSC 9003) TaxID=240176 RepID=D6RNW5_COPC7|nr:hypothetical protein CC1G_14860 [Coprinopsis cinerea okayama7\|eukprot:XP_002910883.1 hypothetical protein CC1G_14860 [Coprinopsis cinerea okayama7\
MSNDRQNIVVVGGGPVGAATVKALLASKSFNSAAQRIVVVTSRPFFVHLPAMIRATVTSEDALETTALMEYGSSFVPADKGEVKFGKVVKIIEDGKDEGGSVVLEGGQSIRYSVLVLATGNLWNGPMDIPDDKKGIQGLFDSWRAKFEKAQNIVLVGGGAVGIEYAGEIKDFFPTKKVTIVQGESKLLNDTYPDKWRDAILARVKRGGVDVILDDLLDQTEPSSDGTVTTRKGQSIKADLIVPTWGGRPNTSFIKEFLGTDSLTPTGHVKVKPTLQLPDHPRIFAAGDIIDWKEQKQAAKAPAHGAVVASNILTLLNGTGELVPYKGSTEIIVVTFGRGGGSAYFDFLWGLIFGDWFAWLLKSRGLLIEMTRSQYGLAAPSSA